MKSKLIQYTLLIFTILPIIYFVFNLKSLFQSMRDRYIAANIADGDYDKCLNSEQTHKVQSPSWNLKYTINTRYLASGVSACYGPKFPVLEVVAKEATHWVHIVNTNGPQSFFGKHSQLYESEQWVFVDVGLQQRRDNDYPFYSEGVMFRDNPSWNSPIDKSLKWLGHFYPVKKVNGILFPLTINISKP